MAFYPRSICHRSVQSSWGRQRRNCRLAGILPYFLWNAHRMLLTCCFDTPNTAASLAVSHRTCSLHCVLYSSYWGCSAFDVPPPLAACDAVSVLGGTCLAAYHTLTPTYIQHLLDVHVHVLYMPCAVGLAFSSGYHFPTVRSVLAPLIRPSHRRGESLNGWTLAERRGKW